MNEENNPQEENKQENLPPEKFDDVQALKEEEVEVDVMTAPEPEAEEAEPEPFALPPKGTLVEVRPLPIEKWHRKKGKEDVSAPKMLEALYDPRTGKYATGLTDEERIGLEDIMKVDLSDDFNMSEPHPYWSSRPAMIRLPRETTLFDISQPMNYVKVKNMKASVLVANSLMEWRKGQWPKATHYIHDEQEATAAEASKVQNRNKARRIAFDLSLDEKTDLVRVLSDKSVRGRSQDFIEVEMDKVIEDRTPEFLIYAQMDRAELTTRAKILECIDRNILTKQGISIYYMGDKVGVDYEAAVKFFLNPQNQMIKVAIFEKLEAV